MPKEGGKPAERHNTQVAGAALRDHFQLALHLTKCLSIKALRGKKAWERFFFQGPT